MADRLVSVNHLQELAYQFYFDRRITELDLFLINRAIEEMPAVDAEYVVRCRDCKHYWKNKPCDEVPVCLASPREDAYCSEGERREDGAQV